MLDADTTSCDEASRESLCDWLDTYMRMPWTLYSQDVAFLHSKTHGPAPAHARFARKIANSAWQLRHDADVATDMLATMLGAWLEKRRGPAASALFASMPQAAMIIDTEHGCILHANPAAAALLHGQAEGLRGLPVDVVLPGYPLQGAAGRQDLRHPTTGLDGHPGALDLYAAHITEEQPEQLALFLENRALVQHWQEQAQLQAQHLHTLMDHLPCLLALLDTRLHYLFANAVHQQWFKAPADSLHGLALSSVFDEITLARLQQPLQEALAGASLRVSADLPTRIGDKYVEIQLLPWLHGQRIEGVYMLVDDVSEQRRLLSSHALEATHDALTALPHRRSFMTSFRAALARRSRTGRGMALLYLGIDGMQALNLRFGQEYGDQVLQHMARVLNNNIRATDLAARLEGDEFVIVLEALEQPEADARRIAEKIARQLEEPAKLSGRPTRLRISTGIVIIHAHAHINIDMLMAEANAAMYQAKSEGRGRYHVARS